MMRFIKTDRNWGDFVFIKTNAPFLIRKELKRIRKGKICIGTVCDPYLKLESRYRITRQILEDLAMIKNPISIQTKASLILRDLDIIKQLKNVEVLITITTTDDRVRMILEPNASSIKERERVIKELVGLEIPVHIFAGPLLPGLSDDQDSIKRLCDLVISLKTDSILFDTLNPYPLVRKRMMIRYQKFFPEHLNFLSQTFKNQRSYQQEIRKIILKTVRGYRINTDILF